MQENPEVVRIRCRSFQSIVDDMIEGIKNSYKNCPDSENKTFEEVAHWAGHHILLTEKSDEEK